MKLGKFNKVTAIVSIVAFTLTMGVIAYAVDATTGENTSVDAISAATNKGKPIERNPLTEEQKIKFVADVKARLAQDLADGKITQKKYDEMIKAIENGEMPFNGKGPREGKVRGDKKFLDEQKALRDAQISKWNELTDAQRAEIYKIYEEKTNIDSKLIDKYLEFGIIDNETANSMKSNLTEEKNNMVNNKRMPMIGRGGHGGKFAPKK